MEALHRELILYLDEHNTVHHPLVVGWFPSDDASRINQLYREKKEQLAKAESDEDWDQYVFLHEKPYRLHALKRAARKGLSRKPSEFWQLAGEVWQGSENIHQDLANWKQLWEMPIENRMACMSAEDRLIFESLPDEVEAWRGTSHKRGLGGLSWTLDQEKAAWFAKRSSHRGRPLLAKAAINKLDVLAYFGYWGESEIVSMQVSIISVTDISASDKSQPCG